MKYKAIQNALITLYIALPTFLHACRYFNVHKKLQTIKMDPIPTDLPDLQHFLTKRPFSTLTT
jgi:hypothetical protein